MNLFTCFKNGWLSIPLIDKYLVIMLIILFAHSFSTIFLNVPVSEVGGHIDIVTRTSLASIFGYCISSNFSRKNFSNNDLNKNIKNSSLNGNKNNILEANPNIKNMQNDDTTPNKNIGFDTEVTDNKLLNFQNNNINYNMDNDSTTSSNLISNLDNNSNTDKNSDPTLDTNSFNNISDTNSVNYTTKLQIHIIGSLCLITIILLIISRHLMNLDNNTIPAFVQFRDIVSAGIGFLIGIPSNSNNS